MLTTNYKILPTPFGWTDDTAYIEYNGNRFIVTSFSLPRKINNSPTISYVPPSIEETLIYSADTNANITNNIPLKVFPKMMEVHKAFELFLKEDVKKY